MDAHAPSDPPNGYGPDVAQFSVRMPDDLRTRIKATADKDGLSMNAWLVLAAEQKLAGSLRSDDVKRLDTLETELADVRRRLDSLEG